MSNSPAFYVPSNLDARLIPKPWRQSAAYFLNLLFWKRAYGQSDNFGFVRLKRDYLVKVILPEVWHPLRERLVSLGVINHDPYWTPGSRSMGYSITPKYRRNTKRIICSDPELAKRFEAMRQKEQAKALSVHTHLERTIDMATVDQGKWDNTAVEPDENDNTSAEERRNRLAHIRQRITNGDTWFTVDIYGRVHTAITNLPRELRCCLKVKGQSLVGLDLANSQPLLAGMLASQFYANRKSALRLCRRKFRPEANPYSKRQLKPVKPNHERPDLQCFLDVCQNGQLYESFVEPGIDREQIKQEFIIAMYSKNSLRTPLKAKLRQLYPSIAGMLEELKQTNHAYAAWLFQNVESTLFIGGIATRLMIEEPKLPIFTIHDSILTIPEGVNRVRAVILEEFEKLGVHPTLKQEEYR